MQPDILIFDNFDDNEHIDYRLNILESNYYKGNKNQEFQLYTINNRNDLLKYLSLIESTKRNRNFNLGAIVKYNVDFHDLVNKEKHINIYFEAKIVNSKGLCDKDRIEFENCYFFESIDVKRATIGSIKLSKSFLRESFLSHYANIYEVIFDDVFINHSLDLFESFFNYVTIVNTLSSCLSMRNSRVKYKCHIENYGATIEVRCNNLEVNCSSIIKVFSRSSDTVIDLENTYFVFGNTKLHKTAIKNTIAST